MLATACLAHATRGGALGLILYDVTTLHFEAENEDALRKVGMSKERRVDPQVQVGLLVDPSGFPLEVHCFEGNTAETSTLLPVLEAFRERHQGAGLVADAGMLSAKNLNAIEDARLSIIVGSRISKAPYDLAAHFERHGNAFNDGQVLESVRVMGTGKAARSRRVVYQYRFSRHKRDDPRDQRHGRPRGEGRRGTVQRTAPLCVKRPALERCRSRYRPGSRAWAS